MGFFNELRRRNVFRVAAAYIVAAWLVIQVAETIFPLFGFDSTPARIVVIVLVIGFVPALVFAWAFELTPQGLRRESEVDRSDSIRPETRKKLDRMIMVVLGLALGYFAFDKFVLSPQREAHLRESQAEQLAEVAAEARQAGRSAALVESYGEKSIAVLAFQDMSQDRDQEYLSDGIAEELLNLLATIPELRVISRSSSFSYKGKGVKLVDIAQELNVAHILEGSVRKAGNQVRITAQLIDARSDTHLWSDTYDRTLDDIFAIQDEIAATVVDQLKVTLLGPTPRATQADPEAYALFLHARHLGRQQTPEAFRQSIELNDQALQIDPGFVSPWANKATSYVNLGSSGLMPRDEALALARESVDRGLALDPRSGEMLGISAWIAMQYDHDLPAAAKLYERALAADPTNNSIVSNAASLVIYLRRYDAAITLREYAVPRNPLNPGAHFNFAVTYLAAGRLEEAERELRTTLRLSPEYRLGHVWLATVLLLKDQPGEALEVSQQAADEAHRLFGQALCYHALGEPARSDVALAKLIQEHADARTYDIASILAFRNEPDRAFEWLSKAEKNNDISVGDPTYDPLFAKVASDPRWAQYLERIGMSQAQLDAIEFTVTLPKRGPSPDT